MHDENSRGLKNAPIYLSKDDLKSLRDCNPLLLERLRYKATKHLFNTKAAVYLSPIIQDKHTFALQIAACEDFIKQRGWVSSDLFVERKGNAIKSLALSRAWSGEFDYLVSFVEFSSECTEAGDKANGIIACIDAQSFVKNYLDQERYRGIA